MAKNLLAVLFNVFSQVGREQRGMVGEVITSYLGVTSETDINATYTKVVTHLGQALQVPYNKATSGGTGPGQASPTSHTMLDLLILLVPFLPKESAQALFAHATGETLIGSDDPAVQKKSYRVLARLIETKKVLVGGEGIEPFVKRLVDGSEVVAAAARRVSRGR
jgi:ribosomal RNA-processing protein 12